MTNGLNKLLIGLRIPILSGPINHKIAIYQSIAHGTYLPRTLVLTSLRIQRIQLNNVRMLVSGRNCDASTNISHTKRIGSIFIQFVFI